MLPKQKISYTALYPRSTLPWSVFLGKIPSRTLMLDLLAHHEELTTPPATEYNRVATWRQQPGKPAPTKKLVDSIFAALPAQTVVVPGTTRAEIIILDTSLNDNSSDSRSLRKQTKCSMSSLKPAALMSMPGVGIIIAASTLLSAGDRSVFPDPALLAAYAGVTPVAHRNGTSIRCEFRTRAGNKRQKHVVPLGLDCAELSRAIAA